MRHAEKFGMPVITLIDIPGADPSLMAEERGQAFSIAENLLVMVGLRVPLVSVIIGEGGSGGALALGVADRVLMFENAVYSVASPEAAASILWKDGARGPEAAEAMKITAPDLLGFGVIDAIIPEPADGAHTDHAAAAESLRAALVEQLAELVDLSVDDLLDRRARRYRAIGVVRNVSSDAELLEFETRAVELANAAGSSRWPRSEPPCSSSSRAKSRTTRSPRSTATSRRSCARSCARLSVAWPARRRARRRHRRRRALRVGARSRSTAR